MIYIESRVDFSRMLKFQELNLRGPYVIMKSTPWDYQEVST